MLVEEILSQSNPVFEITLNPDEPFFKVWSVSAPSINSENYKERQNDFVSVSITIEVINTKGGNIQSGSLFHGHKFVGLDFRTTNSVILDKVHVDEHGFDKIKLTYHNSGKNDLELNVIYRTRNDSVDTSKPFEDFHGHITRPGNTKIFFSAPFGQGKSTFLQLFFEQLPHAFEVFTLFPVNYSVANNEDIFQYIKTEILFDLLERNVEFDKDSFSYALTAPEFFKNKPLTVLGPFIKMLSGVGKSAYQIKEQLDKLIGEYLKFHSSLEIDDEQAASSYIRSVYEKEGSIFEENFFTLLIRQQLQKLKMQNGRENVLVIEDLDRIDPEHIFRILNVLSAHFDDNNNLNISNKFGFDKIILVGDIENIQNIYKHRYGTNVRFDGYMNKYFSIEPFKYDNAKAINSLIGNIRKWLPTPTPHEGLDVLAITLSDLVATKQFTLRDLFKLMKQGEDILQTMSGFKSGAYPASKTYFDSIIPFNAFKIFLRNLSPSQLKAKLEVCRDNSFAIAEYNYSALCRYVAPALVVASGDEHGSGERECFGTTIKINFKETYNRKVNLNFYESDSIMKVKPELEGINLERRHYYDLMIFALERYVSEGGSV